ncbi:hypothetical protein [Immundisolibacter sp.]
MAIEVFLIEEAELISNPEATDEWLQKVNELGLEGQKELAKPEKSPVPFPRLKKAEQRVYETLCPNKVEVQDYNNSTIPLKVLSLIALAEKGNYFTGIQIWDDYEKPDPIAVGYIGSQWNGDFFIIARWDDELRSFAELQNMAVKRWVEEKTADLKDKLANVEQLARKHFKGESTEIS